jgi:hypothetical protein
MRPKRDFLYAYVESTCVTGYCASGVQLYFSLRNASVYIFILRNQAVSGLELVRWLSAD